MNKTKDDATRFTYLTTSSPKYKKFIGSTFILLTVLCISILMLSSLVIVSSEPKTYMKIILSIVSLLIIIAWFYGLKTFKYLKNE